MQHRGQQFWNGAGHRPTFYYVHQVYCDLPLIFTIGYPDSMALLALLVGWMVLFAGGLLLAGIAFEYRRRTALVSNLEDVEARVVSAEIHESEATVGLPATGGRSFTPEVSFRYTYGGDQYSSDRIYPGRLDRVTGQKAAEELVERYAPGTTATAYVNPDRPSEAFLEQRFNRVVYLLLCIVGLMLVALGVGLLLIQ